MEQNTEIPHVNLMICTPGHSMMTEYVKSLVQWAGFAGTKNITWGLATGYSSHVADAREIVLSGTRHNSIAETRPFEGQLTYDKLLWIDSDIEFVPEDIVKLYESDKDIICGGYLIANGGVVVYPSLDHQLSIEEVEKMSDVIEVEGAGFGFMCVKSGVFEGLSRPWFQSTTSKITDADGNLIDFPIMGEDMSWCHRVRELGFKIHFDPSVKVNHHKMMKLTWKGIMPNG